MTLRTSTFSILIGLFTLSSLLAGDKLPFGTLKRRRYEELKCLKPVSAQSAKGKMRSDSETAATAFNIEAQELTLRKFDGSVEGFYAISSPTGATDFAAVRFSVPASIDTPFSIASIRFYNKDAGTIWPRVLIIPDDGEGRPVLNSPVFERENLAGNDTGFVEVAIDTEVAGLGDFYVIIQYPPGVSPDSGESHAGPGIGSDENLSLGYIEGNLFSTDGEMFEEIGGANLAIEVTISGPERTNTNEPNDMLSTATSLTEDRPVKGYLGFPGDLDFYSFAADEDTYLRIDLDASVLGSGLDGYLSLLNADGEIVYENDDEVTALRTDPMIEFIVPRTGTYFLIVDSFEHHNDGTPIAGIDLFYDIKISSFLERPRQIHKTNDLEFTVWARGIYGDDGTGLGEGFIYNSHSGKTLFAGGFLAATPDKIAANIPSYGFADNKRLIDFEAVQNFLPFTSNEWFDQIAICRFEEGAENAFNSPIGLSVRQTSYSSATRPIVFVECSITNISGTPIDDLYFGQFADWDVGPANTEDNQGGYDAQHHLIYQFESGSSPGDGSYYGITALQAVSGARVTNSITGDSLFAFISNFDGPGPNPVVESRDYQSFLGSGPFGLAPGDSQKVVFAWMAANSLAELQTLADEAVDVWNGNINTVDSDTNLPSEFTLSQNYPNPFNPTTRIEYVLPQPGHVRLTIFNERGQEVRRLIDHEADMGRYSVSWDGRDIAGRALPSGIYFYRLESMASTELRKMMLIR